MHLKLNPNYVEPAMGTVDTIAEVLCPFCDGEMTLPLAHMDPLQFTFREKMFYHCQTLSCTYYHHKQYFHIWETFPSLYKIHGPKPKQRSVFSIMKGGRNGR